MVFLISLGSGSAVQGDENKSSKKASQAGVWGGRGEGGVRSLVFCAGALQWLALLINFPTAESVHMLFVY